MKTIIFLLAFTSSALALEPVVKSGTRLQARIAATTYAGADGSSIKTRGRYYIFDTAIGHACEIWPSGTSATCEPTDDLISFAPSEYAFVYSDSACKVPLLQVGNPAIASKVRFFRYTDPRSPFADPGTIYRVGSSVHLTRVYQFIGGRCLESPGTVDALSMTAMPPGPALSSSMSTEVLP